MTQTEQELEIQQAADACLAACKNSKVGDVMQHIHHEQWLEVLTEPIDNRIAFILANKTPSQQAERLRRLRPFNWKKADADRKKAYADVEKAYADWKKAEADRKKAYSDRKKAEADWEKADADRKKAYADWDKACVAPAMLSIHAQVCGCPWDKTHDIFGGVR